MKTLPLVITVFALWIIFVIMLFLAFGLTLPSILLAILSMGGVVVSTFTYRYYGWPYADKGTFSDIKPTDLYSLLEKGERFNIIDVRQPREFARGHVPGSRNVPFTRIERGSAVGERTIFVSGRGRRSRAVIRKVKGKDIMNLREGYVEWTGDQLPTEK
jgi:rhodanese-related sulfurtransferase